MSTQAEVQVAARGTPATAEVIELSYREAICAAMADEMRTDPRVVLLGEDVGPQGGPFKTSEGLLAEFGPRRVIDTPIAENGFLGVALGMAVTGLRPIAEIMFSDFLPVAGDALINEIPKFRLMSGGQASVPLVVRSIGGATGYFGTQHSATGESWLLQAPGIRIVTASTPASAYALLRAAIRLDDPVLFVEHKGLYARKGPVARGADPSDVHRAATLRPGNDVTIVATLLMVERALQAAETLAADGIDAEVIDLRWLNPLDLDGVEHSVRRTGRLVIAEEQHQPGGWGATLIAEMAMRNVTWRSAPRAVSLPYLPTPFSPPLEDAAVPSVERIALAVRGTCDTGGGA
jgi:pyruvate/2-oxoglutarate/acetoin dehydrogenase E1 component